MNTKINFPRFLKAITRQLIPNAGSVLIMAVMLFVYNAQAAPARDDLIGPAAPSLSSNMINYQGSLSTASGTPVTGNIGLTFRLYNIQSGGTALWTEVHANANAVPANKGIFHVLLGSLTPIPTSVWANSNVYLGVQVQGDSVELSPREIVTAVPISVVTANLVIPNASVTTPKIANGAVTQEKLDPNIRLSPQIFAQVGGTPVNFTTSWITFVSTSATLTKPGSVLVTITARAISAQNGDELRFNVLRDGSGIVPEGDVHFQGDYGHQYFSYTFVDTNVPSGSHTYEFQGLLYVGSGTRTIHTSTIILMPLP